MTPLEQIAARAPLEFDRKLLEAYNVERVRSYVERNLGCKKKEIIHALGLNPRTVAKAIRIIRGQQCLAPPKSRPAPKAKRKELGSFYDEGDFKLVLPDKVET